MFGGPGGAHSTLRYLRMGALIALLVGTAVFHVHGADYLVIRGIYFAVIAGVLVASYALSHRSAPGPGGPGWREPVPPEQRGEVGDAAPLESGPWGSDDPEFESE